MHAKNDNISVRFHTDMDKSFEGEVNAYCLDRPWIQTMTEGHDSNGNAIVILVIVIL